MSKSRRAGLFAAVSIAGLMIAQGGARAEDMGDAVALTYETNPTLQAQRASQRSLDETYVQARTGLRPSVSATATISASDSGGVDSNSSSVGVSISQPLYTGGRTISQIGAAEADVLAGREGLRRVEQTVLQTVIQAYVDVRRDLQRLAIANENVTVLERQVQEARARFEVGEITRTDVAQAEARLAGALSSRSGAQATLAISRANYAAVVGQNPGELAPEPPIGNLLPQTIEAAFEAAEENNPQVRAADFTERASAARLAATRAQTRPNISARASIGAGGGSVGGGSPFDDYEQSLSASVTGTVPIYTGGLITSQIRQARERNNVDRSGVETARRTALQQTAIAWNQLLGARAVLASSEQQVRAATIAFEGTRQEAQVGLRTTLDVLNAEQELRNAQLTLVTSRRDEYVAAVAVLVAIGALDVRAIVPNAQVYDPTVNFNEVRHGFGWVPWEPVISAIDHFAAPPIETRPVATPTPTAR